MTIFEMKTFEPQKIEINFPYKITKRTRGLFQAIVQLLVAEAMRQVEVQLVVHVVFLSLALYFRLARAMPFKALVFI